MIKNIFILLLLYCTVKAEYEFETIEELIPKTIISTNIDKFFKYHLSCKKGSDKTSINFQSMVNKYSYHLCLYTNLTIIQKDENGYYINCNSSRTTNDRNPVITFNNLTCNEDYYFVIYTKLYQIDNTPSSFIQFSIINKETSIFNLNPSLSRDYTLFPREDSKEECFYYSFNKDKYALIYYNDSIKIKENDIIIYNSNKKNLFKFKKDLKYYIYYKSNSPIHIQFHDEDTFFKYNLDDFPILLYGNENEYNFEINISDYNVGEYIIFQASDRIIWNIDYQYKNDFNKNNFINLGIFDKLNYIPIQKTKNDSSLLLHIKYKDDKIFSECIELTLFNIVKDAMEIDSDFNSTIKGPKLVFIDNHKLNGLKSFAIESNKN